MRLTLILVVALAACSHPPSPTTPAPPPPTDPTPDAPATAPASPTAAPPTAAPVAPAPEAAPEATTSTAGPLEALAELAHSLAAAEPQGGGSIRSKLDAEPPRSDPRALEARVVAVHTGNFPAVALRLTVLRAATTGPGAAIKPNTALVVVPHFVTAEGRAVLTDPTTATNAGAWYLRAGDKVAVQLIAERGSFWEAERIERR